MGEDPFEELARVERDRRAIEAREQRIRALRRDAARWCTACRQFADGHATWIDMDAGHDIAYLNSHVALERLRELNPFGDGVDWARTNLEFSEAWLVSWHTFAERLRELDTIEPGTVELVVGLAPPSARDRAMHAVLVTMLRGAAPALLVSLLARVRADLVPSREEAARNGGWNRLARFELATYFDWLRRQLEATWTPASDGVAAEPENSNAPPPEATSPSPRTRPQLHDTAAAVLRVLRDSAKEDRGLTADEIATKLLEQRVEISSRRVSEIVRNLRTLGWTISNPGGGTGYLLRMEP